MRSRQRHLTGRESSDRLIAALWRLMRGYVGFCGITGYDTKCRRVARVPVRELVCSNFRNGSHESSMSLAWSEDDIRTKVVYTWLREHGFSADQVHVELGFKIRSGRQLLSTPRTDILVTDGAGRNLLIIEVKAPSVTLTDADRDQAISYAGMVATGNQVPFVVLTNGSVTRIYESATRRLLDGEAISANHRYAQSGFIISGDDLGLLKELVELFVSLSPDNLQNFCMAQVDSRMRLLRGHEFDGGKKYIPELYIEREKASEELRRYLDIEHRPVIFVIGKPQVGKTNCPGPGLVDCGILSLTA